MGFLTIFRQLQANTCRNSELEEDIAELGQDFDPIRLYLQGFCLIFTHLDYICKIFA